MRINGQSSPSKKATIGAFIVRINNMQLYHFQIFKLKYKHNLAYTVLRLVVTLLKHCFL